ETVEGVGVPGGDPPGRGVQGREAPRQGGPRDRRVEALPGVRLRRAPWPAVLGCRRRAHGTGRGGDRLADGLRGPLRPPPVQQQPEEPPRAAPSPGLEGARSVRGTVGAWNWRSWATACG